MGNCSWIFLNGQACEPRDGSCLAYAAGFQGIMCDQGMTSNQINLCSLKRIDPVKNVCYSPDWFCTLLMSYRF